MQAGDDLSISTLLGVLNDYQGTSLTLWNIYLAVVFGILGFVITKDAPPTGRMKVVMTMGFVVFAFGNASFLMRCQDLIFGMSSQLKALAATPDAGAMASALGNLPTGPLFGIPIWAGHLMLDAVVIAALWIGPTGLSRRTRKA